MILSAQSKFYFNLVGGVIIVALVGFFGINFFWQNIKVTNAEIFEQRKKLSSFSNRENYRRELKNEVKQVELYESQVNNWLIDRDRILDFIIELEQIAKNTNNTHTISLMNKSVSGGDSSNEALFFQVNTEASFSNLMKFLESIEQMPYRCDIASLTIQSRGIENNFNDYTASFVLKVNVK